MKLKIQVDPGGRLPTKGTVNSACYDLYIREIIPLSTGCVEFRLGIRTEIPEGYCALVFPRSSITNEQIILANSVGVIDSDFRGEWRARVVPRGEFTGRNSYNEYPIDWPAKASNVTLPKVGEAMFQFMLVPTLQLEFEEGSLAVSDRGEGGFGSTTK